MRRAYGRCAKGGEEKALDPHYVCDTHRAQPGGYTHCAVCGTDLTTDPEYTGRDYVCTPDLVQS